MNGSVPGATGQTVDGHVNLASELTVPRHFIEQQAANVCARMAVAPRPVSPDHVRQRVFSLYQDHDGDRLVEEMDAAGVGRAFLVAPDFSYVADCALDRDGIAAVHDRVRRRHPGRFGVFWGVDPRAGDRGVDAFERTVDRYGFEGMKVYPINGYSPSDPRLYPYYEVCAARGLPVLSHTGPGYQSLDYSYGAPLLLDRAARDFPQVDFILGHGGVRQLAESVPLCQARPNVYLDIAGYPGAVAAGGWPRHVADLLRRGINHKIIFGTDWSAYRMSHTLSSLLAEFREHATVFAGVGPTHRRLIMSDTILALTRTHSATTVGDTT